MPLLAVLANPRAEARAAMRTGGSLAQDILRLVRFSPRARAAISGALRTPPLKVDVSGARGEFVRFRLKDPARFENFRMIVLAPKHLRGMTPSEARSKLGVPGLRRLTLGVIACPRGKTRAHRCTVGTELQSVLVPKTRVLAVAQQYLKRAAVANKRCASNMPVLPMIAGGIAAGVAGAVANKLLRNPGKSVRTYRVPYGCEAKVASALRSLFVWATAQEGQVLTLASPSVFKKVLRHVCGGKAKTKVNRSGRTTVGKNPGSEQNVINIPFKVGRKYSVARVSAWVEKYGTEAMRTRLSQALAQYSLFHKKRGLPDYITYQQYKIGSHKGVSDVEFGVSEGREWLAAYQVPASSGKFMDKASAGRYVHAHGDSDVEVDVKRPVRLSKLPMRFHTPDGKSVGVIPSRNVKIGEWYEG
ncbi:MAG: hypothetical protein ACREI9_04210 [Nitrospiraceae bacterium]